jgi:hypothetical protein
LAQLIDLANRALYRIGGVRLSVLTPEASPTAAMVLELAPPRLDALLADYHWGFATRTLQLTEIAEDLPAGSPYTNQFTVPTDCLSFIKTDTEGERWEIHAQPGGNERRVYLMREGPVYADMVLRIETALYPPHVEQAATAALAAEFAMPITRDATIAAYWEQQAALLLSKAKTHDANEQPMREIAGGRYLADARYGS